MRFERENARPIDHPSAKRIENELKRLRSYGPSSFASLTRSDGSYVQVAGGGVTCLVERRDTQSRRHFRAFTPSPSVRFEDGTLLEFRGGRVALQRDEWFDAIKAAEIFVAFLEERPYPPEIGWRDVSATLGL